MARERKQQDSGGGGCPAWLATYGDMVTLVLTFFILLFSFSSIDKAKWQQVVMSLSGGSSVFNQAMPIPPDQNLLPRGVNFEQEDTRDPEDSTTTEEQAQQQQQQQEQLDPADVEAQQNINDEFDKLYREIMAYVTSNQLEGLMDVEREDGYVILSFKEKMLFASGRAELNEEAMSFLAQIFMMLEGSQDSYRLLRIEGHTDNVPIRTANYEDNWALSMDRAASVLRFIADGTMIDETKFFAGGYGETRPIATNDTEEGKARNRRVDIVCERRDIALENRQAETEVVMP